MSALIPVDLPKMQSLNFAVNLQAQYLTPDQSFYNPWQLSKRRRRSRGIITDNAGEQDEDKSDYSREFIYYVIENLMNR